MRYSIEDAAFFAAATPPTGCQRNGHRGPSIPAKQVHCRKTPTETLWLDQGSHVCTETGTQITPCGHLESMIAQTKWLAVKCYGKTREWEVLLTTSLRPIKRNHSPVSLSNRACVRTAHRARSPCVSITEAPTDPGDTQGPLGSCHSQAAHCTVGAVLCAVGNVTQQ